MVLIIYVLLTISSLTASIINVPGEQPTIQAGLDSAQSADTVLVAAGLYMENIIWPGINGIKLLGAGENESIIDGNQSGSVIRFDEEWTTDIDSTTVIAGFTIQNGNSEDTGYPDNGGGIACVYADPTLVNLKILGNNGGHGGGIYCFSSTAIIENILVSGNSASRGGGIFCFQNSNSRLKNVTITDNTAENNGGGLVCDYSSNPQVITCIISSNSSEAYGGGVSVLGGSWLTLINTVISLNGALTHGGGIFSGEKGSFDLLNCVVDQNTAIQNGGGIFAVTGAFYQVNTIVCNNLGNYGIYVLYAYPNILHSAFHNNESGHFWNCGDDMGVPVMINSNTDSCDVFYNIQMDPLFDGPDTYLLTDFSPCVDAGDAELAGMLMPEFDLLGHERIWDGNSDGLTEIDMGPCEYGAPVINVGDINQDGILNILDIVQAVNCILGTQTEHCDLGDVNQDGTLDILDLVAITALIMEI